MHRALTGQDLKNALAKAPQKVYVRKTHPNAEIPVKVERGDVGYSVTLTGRADSRTEDDVNDVGIFNTGIELEVPEGHYVEIVAVNTLYRHGYMLASGTTIVGPGKHGELLIPLFKFKDSEDIELPFRGVQMIMRENIPSFVSHVAGSSQQNVMGVQERNYYQPEPYGAYARPGVQPGNDYHTQVSAIRNTMPASTKTNHFY